MKPRSRRGVFKHILIATDGSPLSARAEKAAIALAGALGARVTAYCAVEEPQPIYVEGEAFDQAMMSHFDVRAKAVAEGRIRAIAKVAKAAGVRFNGLVRNAKTAYEGIIDAARRQGCDVIVMASHGRRGLSKLMMGSVTQKVLTHSKIPVVVYR